MVTDSENTKILKELLVLAICILNIKKNRFGFFDKKVVHLG